MYIVIEMQTNNGQAATITTAYADLNVAYQKYYTILAAAAVSNVEIHSAMIITPTADLIVTQHFDHRPQSEAE